MVGDTHSVQFLKPDSTLVQRTKRPCEIKSRPSCYFTTNITRGFSKIKYGTFSKSPKFPGTFTFPSARGTTTRRSFYLCIDVKDYVQVHKRSLKCTATWAGSSSCNADEKSMLSKSLFPFFFTYKISCIDKIPPVPCEDRFSFSSTCHPPSNSNPTKFSASSLHLLYPQILYIFINNNTFL